MAANNSLLPPESRGPSITKIDPVTIPGFGPSIPNEFDPSSYKVRYAKIDMDDIASVAELEILETKALRNEGVYILNKDKYTFLEKYFLIVSYLEQGT